MSRLNVALLAFARPTFDMALAKQVTAQAHHHLRDAGLEVTFIPELLSDLDALQGAMAALEGVPLDAVIVLQATFADSTLVQALARQMSAPLLLWGVPEERVGGRLRLNSFCGINLAAHALKRSKLPYATLYSAPDAPEALAKIRALALAGKVKRALKGMKIGRVGENPPGFETCLVNYEGLRETFGVEIVQMELADVFAEVRATPERAIAEVQARLAARLSNFDEMEAKATQGTLKTYHVLKQAAQSKRLNGYAVRCWADFFTDLGCAACGAMSLLSDELCPASCEADVNGTVTQLILQTMSGEPAFGTDIVAFDDAQDLTIVWHCGLAPLSMADPHTAPQATIHSNRQMPLLMEFPLKAGVVTVARLSEASGQFKLVLGRGEMVAAPPSFTGTTGALRFERGAQAVRQTLLDEGLEHHLSLTYGDYSEALEALAGLWGLELIHL
jgi:L-fucose isomerase-like protein